jgi:formiminoglutamase
LTALHHDPRWPRANAWLGNSPREAIGRLAILGAPLKLGSITPGRCDLAPTAIRDALARFTPYDIESGRDLSDLRVRDYGDLAIADLRPADAFEPLRAAVASTDADAIVILGGDNSITRPAFHGLNLPLSRCGLLTLDAHLDLRDLDAGLTNGNPVRALLADGLPGSNIVQIGMQAFANSKAYAHVARDAGIRIVPCDEVHAQGIEIVIKRALDELARIIDVIYVDLDLDVLDRAFAPATPGSRPGGLAPWQIRKAARLCGLHPKVRAMDLVEIDPTRDIAEATVLAAAACLLSFASGLHQRLRP